MHLALVLVCPVGQGEGRMERWEKKISDACCLSSSLSGLYRSEGGKGREGGGEGKGERGGGGREGGGEEGEKEGGNTVQREQ